MTNKYDPDSASHPGETFKALLIEKDVGVMEFADKYRLSLSHTSFFINGKTLPTQKLMQSICEEFGTPMEFWVKRIKNYKDSL